MPSSHRDLFPRTDEKKVLEQLEKFQREIQSARWKREQASAEFESFVKGFEPRESQAGADRREEQPRRPAPSVVRGTERHSFMPPPRSTVAPPPTAAPQPTAAPRLIPATGSTSAPAAPAPADRAPAPVAEPDSAPDISTATFASDSPSYSMRLQHWRGIALVGAALVAIVLLAIGWWKNAPESSTRGGSDTTTAAAPAAAVQPSTAPPAADRPSPAPVAQHAVTLTTTRRVWVRVMADGHRLFERELAAGQNVPIDATQAIVIRAGDAGAVRLAFADGRAETLGAEGQVVTKRYEMKK